jgi:hypothetical protein
MMTRLIRIGMAALLTAVLSSRGWAQDEDANADDDSDPCADAVNPCGGADSDDEGGGEAAGGEEEEVGEPDDGAGPGGMSTEGEVTGEAAPMGPTLPAGKISMSAALQVGFSTELGGGEAGTPLSIAPDVWYGINDKLSAGAVTSIHGRTGFWGGQVGPLGTGVCLSDEPGTDGVAAGCNGVFDNAGVEALYALTAGESLGLAASAGLHALSFDPMLLDVKLGARAAGRWGRIWVGAAPSIFIALTERGDEGGNDDQLVLPVDVGFMITSSLGVGAQSGIAGSLQSFGEDYVVPVAFGALFHINAQMMVAAAFSFDRVTGGTPEGVDDPLGTADVRSASLVFGYTL